MLSFLLTPPSSIYLSVTHTLSPVLLKIHAGMLHGPAIHQAGLKEKKKNFPIVPFNSQPEPVLSLIGIWAQINMHCRLEEGA